MLRLSKLVRRTVGSVAGSVCGLAATPVFAALTDIDWNSYLDWKSFNWPFWLLLGGVAMLMVGFVIKASRPARPPYSENLEKRPARDRYTRRIGTMPIHPSESLDSHLVS